MFILLDKNLIINSNAINSLKETRFGYEVHLNNGENERITKEQYEKIVSMLEVK